MVLQCIIGVNVNSCILKEILGVIGRTIGNMINNTANAMNAIMVKANCEAQRLPFHS
jgi:hypothetical protein